MATVDARSIHFGMNERQRLLNSRIEFCRQLLRQGVDARQAETLLALVRELELELAQAEAAARDGVTAKG
jgi:hypothetical protein